MLQMALCLSILRRCDHSYAFSREVKFGMGIPVQQQECNTPQASALLYDEPELPIWATSHKLNRVLYPMKVFRASWLNAK